MIVRVDELEVGYEVSFTYLSSDGMVMCKAEITGFTDKFVKHGCGTWYKKTQKDKLFEITKLS